MNCIICKHPMSPYFSKAFDSYGLDTVDYEICAHCGFCASKTHYEMSDKNWAKLNDLFHSKLFIDRDDYQSSDNEDYMQRENYRLFQQAQMISILKIHGLISGRRNLDWGAGSAKLSKQLQQYYSVSMDNYDRFMKPSISPVELTLEERRSYDLVVNTCVFEHVRSRDTLDEIESYVKDSGCLAIHTLVPNQVPKDVNWMYLLPVHCSFHSNRSMEILIEQWGYQCSIYNEHSKMWVFFKTEPQVIEKKIRQINDNLGWNYLHFKRGFVDYWK